MGTTLRKVAGVAMLAAWSPGAGPAWAAGVGDGSLGLWTLLFLAFGALVIAFQAVPAVVLFGSLLRSLFLRRPAGAEAAREDRRGA